MRWQKGRTRAYGVYDDHKLQEPYNQGLDFKASNELRPHPSDTEEPSRFQSTDSCSGIIQMCGGEHDEAETRGRELCKESCGEGSLGQGSGQAKRWILKLYTRKLLRLTWGTKRLELPLVGTTVPSHAEPSNPPPLTGGRETSGLAQNGSLNPTLDYGCAKPLRPNKAGQRLLWDQRWNLENCSQCPHQVRNLRIKEQPVTEETMGV